MKVFVEAIHTITSRTGVELPKGKTSADIDYVYIKWGTLKIAFSDDTEMSVDLNDLELDSIDHKHPDTINVFEADDSGQYPNYDAKVKV